ncbi:MAG: tRNA (adenosine(37)-N6)-threonylcarbamoyltransferase complex ATPase subunit type 1 TsaE [Alphaproteobacteria bacterium]|nr:tRNA (adenosine(37)-N6)-threonylcarbamoyltransferase complex ATPase subunit type 1 TsaE [Alphaproteobacteria bacterium]
MADSRASKPLSLVFDDEAATARFGAKLAAVLRPGDVVALSGGLGSGKTALARAVVRTFQPDEEVPSPTFTLVQTYAAPRFQIWHVDLYRLNAAREVQELGLDEAIDEGGVLLIEWPERAGAWLPGDRLDIALSIGAGASVRRAEITAYGNWVPRLDALR